MTDYEEDENVRINIAMEFNLPLLKKMKRAEIINTIQMEIDFAVGDVMKELDICLEQGS